ncbi:hypothetical protein [Mesorhizobium sp. M7D.F.Ca.US.005.01.1.1]|uniref:hypothetical protein n=1 Tax=Mesorhizobium sp. M7D.F.Ca.US.005.01.1.1 TaxID=2493678 RepID=UPI0013E0AFE4|nr:hypothetical protein [Mesorhizobium sp. M7D.F.Ca.US.005.01.1.1]
MDLLEAARLLRFSTDWERRFHEYDLLLTAGVHPDEAERIVRRVAADRQALQPKELAA